MDKFLIVGGTGTLGTALVESLAGEDHDITVFSRCELKQSQMRQRFPEVRFILGDIRDPRSINQAMQGVDTVFHVAALKHVEVGEENPVEFIKTNILGTVNVAEAALAAGVRNVIFSSTDKAVLAVNTYGMTKGISERYLLSLNQRQTPTRFAVYRWGNVAGSRGSVIHSFVRSLKENRGVTITDARMSRFWIHLDDAVDFMLTTYAVAARDRVMIPPMKAAKVIDLASSLADILRIKDYAIAFSGLRAGEKIHETLESNHEFCLRSDTSEQFTAAELKTLLRRVL